MPLPKRYRAEIIEPELQAMWQQNGIYHFDTESQAEVYSIDTPPATVSGRLHLGHVYSYTHPDLIARFKRMQGYNIFYPMGYDDNGLPTERLVENQLGMKSNEVGRDQFIRYCLEISSIAEKDYRELWQRLGLSIDWRFTYRTVDDESRRLSQQSFIDLYNEGKIFRAATPTIWCPECSTAIAQAELNDLDADSEFITLNFSLDHDKSLPVSTTRPELLPACVAIFVHPDDKRYAAVQGKFARVPLYNREVPILVDQQADPQKGTGAVMCCTFGDVTDISWWKSYNLPYIQVIDAHGKMTAAAGPYTEMPIKIARKRIKADLTEQDLLVGVRPIQHSIRVHERCDTPVEYIEIPQWFIQVLDYKDLLVEAGENVNWHPPQMETRYQAWVNGLNWDWCISRQRYFGVPFPLWYCCECGEVSLADSEQLPVDPLSTQPSKPCACGYTRFIPERDVMDTWATSSLTPQIAGDWLGSRYSDQAGSHLFGEVFPYSLRPQAHEIIRTWAFYTIVKSQYHLRKNPWKDILISGWGIAGEGEGKISKSRGGGPMPPLDMIECYSADAVRYWAASTSPGKDAVISVDKIKIGQKLITKLWNVARFGEQFFASTTFAAKAPEPFSHIYTPGDRWICARLQDLIRQATVSLDSYEYAAAKSEIETFFWQDLADNYLEMAKQRLYSPEHLSHSAATATLEYVLFTLLLLLGPYLPHITEKLYLDLFYNRLEPKPVFPDRMASIHTSIWPEPIPGWDDKKAMQVGTELVAIATGVRRYKSERSLSLATPLTALTFYSSSSESPDPGSDLERLLQSTSDDLRSITRAAEIKLIDQKPSGWLSEETYFGCYLHIEP